MMTLGRPMFLPVVNTVSAFQPWVFPNKNLTPHQVATSLSMMLASHGYSKATFSAHSFGTFWMSYMVKYAPDFVASLVFLDPVNFCLYNHHLARQAIYNCPDPGDIGYMVLTDMMVNWSFQRSFSWARVNLFVEDIGDIPFSIFLSSEDRIAPSKIQESYLRRRGGCDVLKDYDQVEAKDHSAGNSVIVFRGYDHGLWMMNPLKTMPQVVEAMEVLSWRVESMEAEKSAQRKAAGGGLHITKGTF